MKQSCFKRQTSIHTTLLLRNLLQENAIFLPPNTPKYLLLEWRTLVRSFSSSTLISCFIFLYGFINNTRLVVKCEIEIVRKITTIKEGEAKEKRQITKRSCKSKISTLIKSKHSRNELSRACLCHQFQLDPTFQVARRFLVYQQSVGRGSNSLCCILVYPEKN